MPNRWEDRDPVHLIGRAARRALDLADGGAEGDVLPEHARSRCEEMAMWCSAAPELPDEIA